MKAEIISIGDELLIGQTVNTNAAFIAEKLTEIGVEISCITTIGDSVEHIIDSIKAAENRSAAAVFTGGLGPTHDDVTKTAFAKYFSSRLILDKEILHNLRQRFNKRKVKMVKVNEQQAMIPDNAVIIPNKMGTAPGLLFDKNKKYFFVLPGVPVEMKAMMSDFVLPFLKEQNDIIIKKRVLHFSGIPESTLFQRIGNVEKLEKFAKIAFLPHFGMIDVRLTAAGTIESECEKRIERVEKAIRSKAASFIWGVDEDKIEDIIVNKLNAFNKTLSIVELGSNGRFTTKLIANQDLAHHQVQGFILPSLAAFQKLFSIENNPGAASKFGSEETAKYLATNLKEQTGSDLALAIIFNADEVGRTFIVLADETETKCWIHFFPFDGDMAIERVCLAGLHHFCQYLNQKFA